VSLDQLPVRVYLRRLSALGRTVDLDSRTDWPSSVTVVDSDELGPLVISVSNATVFPDGSVTSGGRWLASSKFGLKSPSSSFSELLTLDEERGFVFSANGNLRELVEVVGPQLATLGRTRSGLGLLISATRHSVSGLLSLCDVTESGRLLDGGFAYRVTSALFARVPSFGNGDRQFEEFAELFRSSDPLDESTLFLERDNRGPRGRETSAMIDLRLQHELAGARLVSPGTLSVVDVARRIARSSRIVLESPATDYLGRLANPRATVATADSTVAIPRHPSRVTVTNEFDIDAALRAGERLPPGVELISRPDYEIEGINVADHRVFDGRRWRRQSPDVVNEQSLGPHLLAITNAIVTPNAHVILSDGTLLTGSYFGGPRMERPSEGWVASEVNGRAGLAVTHAMEFGHFLLQAAPRIDALTRFDSEMSLMLTKYSWDDTSVIRRAGADIERVWRMPRASAAHFVRVPELIVSTHLQPENRMAGADPRWLSGFVSRFVEGLATEGERRIHMARGIDSGRRSGCLNRAEIHAIANDFGYETVFPETLSVEDQIRLVTSTTEMFGEQGSALTWAMFMRPGSDLVVVQNELETRKNRYVKYHNSVMAARQSRYFDIGAVRAGRQRHFEIDPEIVRRALEKRR
jgi:hypothetical protein